MIFSDAIIGARMSKRVSGGLPAKPASSVVQDFLSEAYLESLETGRVSLRSLATRLGVTPPAVSRMAQRLVRQGSLRREGACGLVLSEAGERIALRAIRKRRVFEVYLVQNLGYTWDDVYPVAAQTSNHLDDDLVERMYQQLNRPQRCPHGDPIPTHDGRLPAISASKLSELSDGAQGVVSRVSSHDGDMLRYLASLNIRPGAPIRLMARAPFSGPLRLRVANGSFHDEHVIGAELASRIWVEDVTP
jgi:DtxR family Mn-dependent transcriptional regulator